MGSKSTTETEINKLLKEQSNYLVGEGRSIYDNMRGQAPPSLYGGIDPTRERSLQMMIDQAGQTDPSGVRSGVLDEYNRTMSGHYLQNQNPWLEDIVNRAAGSAVASEIPGFGRAGRLGSGAYGSALSDAFARTRSNLFGQNYQRERDRMQQYASMAPQMNELHLYGQDRATDLLGRAGSAYERDARLQGAEDMRQFEYPMALTERFNTLLASSPLMGESIVTKKQGMDWGSAIFGALGSVAGGAMGKA